MSPTKISPRELDSATVNGWIEAAQHNGEPEMVKFYQRIVAALKAGGSLSGGTGA